jgi:tetratricopeptide (TPR) repeat protein
MPRSKFGGRDAYREAQAAYEKALELQPAQLEAEIYMANLMTDTGRVERAVPLLRRALEANPNHAEAHWELGCLSICGPVERVGRRVRAGAGVGSEREAHQFGLEHLFVSRRV